MIQSKRVAGLSVLALLLWAGLSGTPDSHAPGPEAVTPAAPPSATVTRKHIPAPEPAAESEMLAWQPGMRIQGAMFVVHLRPESPLMQEVLSTQAFQPSDFLPIPDDLELPDSAAADAFLALLDDEDPNPRDTIDDFLNAVEDDPDLQGFDEEWVDIIDLESERLLTNLQYEEDEAEVLAILKDAHKLPAGSAAFQSAMNLPAAQRNNANLLALTSDIIRWDPLAPSADIARLYAAREYADYASSWTDETRATTLILDTLASSEDPAVQQQAVRLLADLSPGKLPAADIELLQHSWYTLGDGDRGQLSRFLTDQHFMQENWHDAEVWSDRFEAEILAGDITAQAQRDHLWEIGHMRARIGAHTQRVSTDWRIAIEQSAWTCWEGAAGDLVTDDDDWLEIHGLWSQEWRFSADPADHPLSECIITELRNTPDPVDLDQLQILMDIRVVQPRY